MRYDTEYIYPKPNGTARIVLDLSLEEGRLNIIYSKPNGKGWIVGNISIKSILQYRTIKKIL